MIRGLYTAAAGMMTQQRRHDTATNNISNVNTPGFKQVNAVARSFPDMLLDLTGIPGEKPNKIGVLNTGVFAEESLSVHKQGDLTPTNRMSDFAIVSDIIVDGLAFDESGKAVNANGEIVFQPQAFFTLQDRNGEVRYSRDGTFTLNDEGYLVSSDGSSVLGSDGQPIQFEPGMGIEQLTMTSDQRFIDMNGLDTGRQLQITLIDNPNRLIREGGGKFRLNEEDQGLARAAGVDERFEVRQGFIERSNVDATQAMVDLMGALRAYESNQKIIQYYDKSLEKAVNEIGRV